MGEYFYHVAIRLQLLYRQGRLSFWILRANLFFLLIFNKKPNAMIVKTDAIGDYLLMRNFWQLLKSDPFYSKFHWHLVVGKELETFISVYDLSFFESIHYLDKRKYVSDPLAKSDFLKKIQNWNPTLVFNTQFSKEKSFSEDLTELLNVKFRIGNLGVAGNISVWEKNLTNLKYDYLIPNATSQTFEFYRNKEMFSLLGFKQVNEITFKIDPIKIDQPLIEGEYCILSPFSRQPFKVIPTEISIKILQKLGERFDKILLLCGPDEVEKEDILYQSLTSSIKEKVVISKGNFTLDQIVNLIHCCKLLVSSDSMYVHVAAALRKKFIVLWKGDHYGRFLPYPKEIFENYSILMPAELEKMDESERIRSFRHTNNMKIKDIAVEKIDLL